MAATFSKEPHDAVERSLWRRHAGGDDVRGARGLDHVIVINERSLERTLKSFSSYYHSWRTHLSLRKDTPQGRQIQTPDEGTVIEIQEVGGLHHHYKRRVA